MQAGIEQGSNSLVLRLLIKRVGTLPSEVRDRID
ncbi:MAG: DUF4351 domain-containing protein [Leptolyngbya sp. Prado105]|nr:DUF4351 domain-containing protein [Leptolyngbya sp. Prado105]